MKNGGKNKSVAFVILFSVNINLYIYTLNKIIVHKSVEICVSEHFSFGEIIHPPHRCGISRF